MIFWLGLLWAQDKPAYLLYTSKGKLTSYTALLLQAEKADVVFFGELHDDPIAHWLSYELVRDLHAKRQGEILIGMEMFETDQQSALARYLGGLLTMEQLAETIKLWPNFHTDYAPIVEWAQREKVPVYATNAPRALAREIARAGAMVMDRWDADKRSLVAPLPFPRLDSLQSYQQMSEMAANHGMDPEPFRLAQMLKDATMAYRIKEVWRPGKLFFHLNGSFHSDYKEGIAAYLRIYAPTLRVLNVSTVRVPDPKAYRPPKSGLADFILVVPESMTRTH
ncbi:MAG: ChaN family lipoprotein [Bacteroidia bacterium]|nr:ChaN family lipoprotein [Bacteroidia bacterium]MCX7651515.1 ChaN family lipoprotein [Bacteroidia bacterium]MDW8416812.1 ChaN family lipoprotein [Bacteroidia bacterium]